MNKKEKKVVYWYLKEKLDKLEAECFDCDDIDCSRSPLYKMLEKKHRVDVIDKKACMKQMKQQAKELRKIVYSPFFREQRLSECHHCKKKFERDELKFGDVARFYNGSVQMGCFCKDCAKKYKIRF